MRPIVPLVVLLSALVACKMFKKEEPAPASALPPPEPPPTASAAEPTPTVEPTATVATPTATAVTTKKSDPGAKDAGAKDASAPSDAGKNAACASKCQGILQACLVPGQTEAGLPQFADPTKCQAAFDECAKACK